MDQEDAGLDAQVLERHRNRHFECEKRRTLSPPMACVHEWVYITATTRAEHDNAATTTKRYDEIGFIS